MPEYPMTPEEFEAQRAELPTGPSFEAAVRGWRLLIRAAYKLWRERPELAPDWFLAEEAERAKQVPPGDRRTEA